MYRSVLCITCSCNIWTGGIQPLTPWTRKIDRHATCFLFVCTKNVDIYKAAGLQIKNAIVKGKSFDSKEGPKGFALNCLRIFFTLTSFGNQQLNFFLANSTVLLKTAFTISFFTVGHCSLLLMCTVLHCPGYFALNCFEFCTVSDPIPSCFAVIH